MSIYESLFSSSSVPALEQVLAFSQSRNNVLTGNIANLDTPGYRSRDLSVADFQTRLREALASRDRPAYLSDSAAASFSSRGTMAEVASQSRTILRHDDGNVSMEEQVSEMVKNQLQHNLALTIMVSQFRLLQTAISEKV